MKLHTVHMVFLRNIVKTTPYLLAALLLLYFFSQPAVTDSTDSGVSQAVEALLSSKQHPLLLQQDFSRHSEALTQLYRTNANQLLWLGEGRPEKNRNDALSVLNDAASDGLKPVNYDAERLRAYLQQAASLPQTATKELASYDLALSISLLRFVQDVHAGRVNPRDLNYPTEFGTKPPIDIAALLMHHREQQSLAELPQAVAPNLKQYRELKQALAHYRQQAQFAAPAPLSFAKSLRPGEQHSQLPELRKRLLELGELTADEIKGISEAETLYDEVSAAAIARLQQQQGLNADGVIGKQTLAILNQTATEKINLIELAMERLRWLPEQPDGPLIIVNIPAFQLWALNAPDEQNPLNMKVIVGKALKNQTPMLWEEMKYLEFNPYWNIPKSIMDKEIMPKMLTDYEYLSNQDIELIDRTAADDDEEYLDNVIDNIKHGRVRARQRPGKKNPLGRVKFIFPNKADVYLHDTPSRGAFNRDRRDLSHGCVRVAEPEKLAEFVLDSQEGWDKQAIQQAMASPKTQRVSLKKSIPVLFFYTTAFVDQDHKPRFYPDIYGQDALLRSALNKTPGLGSNNLLISKNTVAGG